MRQPDFASEVRPQGRAPVGTGRVACASFDKPIEQLPADPDTALSFTIHRDSETIPLPCLRHKAQQALSSLDRQTIIAATMLDADVQRRCDLNLDLIQTEIVACALCEADGKNPDEEVPSRDRSMTVKAWTTYEIEARRFIVASRALERWSQTLGLFRSLAPSEDLVPELQGG
jgi:hypothetical protein